MKRHSKTFAIATAFVAGLTFAFGLGISGMTRPEKVQGFLNIFGEWDPSLAFVMGGAVVVYAIGYRLVVKRSAPLFESNFSLPTRKELTPTLITGSALFGVGWGLVGLCPGPAIVSSPTSQGSVLLFVAAMLAGFYGHHLLTTRIANRAASSQNSASATDLSEAAAE